MQRTNVPVVWGHTVMTSQSSFLHHELSTNIWIMENMISLVLSEDVLLMDL